METNIFIPGRLCLIGEHSDWAAIKNQNSGYAIATILKEGIYAKVSKNKKIIICNNKNVILESDLSLKQLEQNLKDNYLKYIANACYYILNNYDVGGIKINIYKTTLLVKKGLASSTAIILTIIESFNKVYNLKLSKKKKMQIAYDVEHYLGSKCGMLDTICAYKNGTYLIEFRKTKTLISKIDISKKFYFIYADLNKSKNTLKILSDLNNNFDKSKKMQKFLGIHNERLVNKAIEYLKNGDSLKLGKVMVDFQKKFDKSLIPVSKYLEAPYLHKLLNDKFIKKNSYGSKGIGSGGDGGIQILAKSNLAQKEIINYLKEKYDINAISLVLEEEK